MKKMVATLVVFLAAGLLGFQMFASEPRSEVSSLNKRVESLQSRQESGPEQQAVPKPSQAELDAALQKAIRSSGIVVDETNQIAERIEIVSESDPAVVARFAEDVSRGPLIAVALTGDLLPLSVVTVVPKYSLAQ